MKTRLILFSALIFSGVAFADQAPVVDLSQNTEATATTVARPEMLGSPITQSLSLDQRVARLENQMNNLVSMNLPSQIQDLQQQMQQINGQLQVQAHSIQTLDQQQRNFYQDLDQRLTELKNLIDAQNGSVSASSNARVKQLAVQTNKPDNKADKAKAASDAKASKNSKSSKPSETNTKANSVESNSNTSDSDSDMDSNADSNTSSSATATSSIDTASDSGEQDYQKAFSQLVAKNYVKAETQFKNFLQVHPNSSFAANAHYWLGEIYLQQKQPKLATKAFDVVINQYPKSVKVPDALLKRAMANSNQGQTDQAKQDLQNLIKNYPDSSAARLARIQLKSLNLAS